MSINAIQLQRGLSLPQFQALYGRWECFFCSYQSSSIAGTVMEHAHLPRRLRLLAMYLLTQNKNTISAPALKHQLGVPYKTAFVAAVQTSADGRPLYMRLTPVVDFTNEHMRQWASHHLTAGCHVVSDGTRAFAQVQHAQTTHERYVAGRGRQGHRRRSCAGRKPCWATS